MRAYFMDYDIPELSGVKNPARMLRRRAIWMNGSVWLILDGNIPNSWVSVVREKGCTVNLVRFADDEAAHYLASATAALMKRAARLKAKADRAAESDPNEGETEDGHVARIRRTLRDVERELEDLRLASASFGITSNPIDNA